MSVTLPPVPGEIIAGKEILTPTWRSWFNQLYSYVTQQFGNVASLVSPAFTGSISINGTKISTGTAAPTGSVTGNVGDLYVQTGGLGTLWTKQSGTDANGWADGGWYGAFYDTTTQSAPSATTAYAVTINTQQLSNGVYIGSPSSNIYVRNPGRYNIQFSAQLQNTSTSLGDVQWWIRQNGGDVANSNSLISVTASHGGVNGHTLIAWNWVLDMLAGDYFTMMWQSSTSAITIQSYAAGTTPTTPAIPSIILTVTQI